MAPYNMSKCNLFLKTRLKHCDLEVYLKMKITFSFLPLSIFWQSFCPPLDSHPHVKHNKNVEKDLEEHYPIDYNESQIKIC